MMASSSMLLLLAASLVADLVVDASCLHCVSPLITLHARKFPINFDRTSVGDAKCARNLTKVHLPAGCKGACLTMNLTREGESEPAGVLRDCLDSHKSVRKNIEEKKETDSLNGVCYSESVQIKGTMYTATYCACVGVHCNNEGTPLALASNGVDETAARRGYSRRGSRYRSSPNWAATGVQSFALVAALAALRL